MESLCAMDIRRTGGTGFGHRADYCRNVFGRFVEKIVMRLKIEINTREHFNILGLKEMPYEVSNEWVSGKCSITGYEIEELLGTKLKALYQRKKGRDLYYLYFYIHLHINYLPSKNI